MPRRLYSSSSYLARTRADQVAGRKRLEEDDVTKIEPLAMEPDYMSITWLAGKIATYGQSHPSATAIRGNYFIGQGATFSVYRATYGDHVYAVKQPRLVFQYGKDSTDTMRQLYSLHLELRVLADRRIRSHGNIAQLIMVTWEEHADDMGRHWPSLVMEYADHGTLAASYARGLKLDLEAEKLLCFGIGDALHFLHQNGVVHGDIKPENVLMFSGRTSASLIPKLSDFGFSILDQLSNRNILGGTADWEAPEILIGTPPSEHLTQSDTYSFGLLVWYISRDGMAPFADIGEIQDDFESDSAREAIRSLKQTSQISMIATRSLPPGKSCYSGIFNQTLVREVQNRDLRSTLLILDERHPQNPNVTISSAGFSNAGQDNNFNVREFRHLEPRIQVQVAESLAARTKATSSCNELQRSQAAFALSQICLECLAEKETSESVEWLELAAKLNHPVAMALLYRVSKALGLYKGNNSAASLVLWESAKAGIRISIQDLLGNDPARGEEILQDLRKHERAPPLIALMTLPPTVKLGDLTVVDEIGDSLLHQAARLGDALVIAKLLEISNGGNSLINSQNHLGQTPLLLACIEGEYSASMALLDSGARAEIADQEGDTPLHWLHMFDERDVEKVAESLVRNGANVRAISRRFEEDEFSRKVVVLGTPLHRAAAWNSRTAVRVLLDYGADPLAVNGPQHKLSTPLWLACTFHNSEAIKIMLQYLSRSNNPKRVADIINDEPKREWPFLKPVLDIGYYYRNGGMLGRIARHGEHFRLATEETIRTLKQYGTAMFFPGTVHRPGIPGHPALSSALLLRCVDVVKVMLKAAPEFIEQRDPKYVQPPLHFAVQQDRLDLVEILLAYEADVHARSGSGITALSTYANSRSGLVIPKLLLQHGGKFEIPPNHFQTPFFGAVVKGSFELADFILENTAQEERNQMINASCCLGPSFRTNPPGLSALGYLLESCHQNLTRAVCRLFDVAARFGETVDLVVEPGRARTAFHVLSELKPQQRLDAVVAATTKELLSRCDNKLIIDSVSDAGKTPLWYAVRNLSYDLVDCFLTAGANPNIADREDDSPMSLLRHQVIHCREFHKNSQEKDTVASILRLFEDYGYPVFATT